MCHPMLCPVCNSPSENAEFCSHCGYKLPKGPAPAKSTGRKRVFRLHLLLHIVWLAVPLYFYGRLLMSGAYLTSLSLAESSPAAQKVLGTGIHVKTLPIGSALRRYNSDFAEWSVTLKGSLGSGRLYGVANNINRGWEFSRLILVPSKGGKIDLTPTPPPLRVSPEDAKRIYLVPFGLLPEQSLDWAPAYYKAMFDADVQILPAITPTSSEEDPTRHQLDAEKCIDLILRSHRNLAADPHAILVAVTSRDMFIQGIDWRFAENFREGPRFAIVSSAHFGPTEFPGKWNEELLNSRLQKMLTKNLAILYFDLPLSSDYTSLLSAGVLSGREIDYMSERILGSEGQWDPFFNEGEPMVTLTVDQDKPATWSFGDGGPLEDLTTEQFSADMAIGLFIQRKMDFYLDGDYPLKFTRVYRNADDRSRSFGVGTNDSLDIFLVGQMGSFIDLIGADGSRSHFIHQPAKPGAPPQVYLAQGDRYSKAVYDRGVWRVTSTDGWTYLFPYRPQARTAQVTVLTGFFDPEGHEFMMDRNDSGDLLGITTPSGGWLHFEYDDSHRISRISDSQGRSMRYEYDANGRLDRVSDNDGHSETYTYDDRNEMLSVSDGAGSPMLSNQFTSSNLISSQSLADGRQFEYGYNFGTRMVIRQSFFTDPKGIVTYFDYGEDGYMQSLPTRSPQ